MARPWYPKYPDDYARDTAHLSFAEHGVYGLLIDQYNRTAAPLPADPDTLFRICRGNGKAERKALESVLSQYFERRGDHFHQGRADRELARAQEIHDKRVKGGKARAHAQHMLSTCSESASAQSQVRARTLQLQSQLQVIEPNGSMIETPLEIWQQVWTSGKNFLTASGHSEGEARKALVRWRQQFGENEILRALKIAQANAVIEPIPYIETVLKGNPNARLNGRRTTTGQALEAIFGDRADKLDAVQRG